MPFNVSTIAVLIVVAVLLALALRSIVKGRKKGKCPGCSEEFCTGHGVDGTCPTMGRALADVEARLGALDGAGDGGGPRG